MIPKRELRLSVISGGAVLTRLGNVTLAQRSRIATGMSRKKVQTMSKALKKIYTFLFKEHDVGFMRFCYAMLIPCALWDTFCHWWMVFMTFVLMLVIQANTKGWNRRAE